MSALSSRWLLHFLTPCLLAGMALCAAASEPAERYEGIAYARDSNTVLYRETHWLYRDGASDKRLVLYRCSDGRPFARKVITPSPSATAPDFEFYDARLGYHEGVSGDGTRRTVYTKARSDSATKQREISLGDNDVIDVGFDAYVRAHFDKIAPGVPLRASLLIPGRFATIPLLITETAGDNKDLLPLRIQMDAWYRSLAPSMTLAYSRLDRRLLEFQGIGTIRGTDGRNLDVRILYPGALRDTTLDTHEALADLQRPLSEQCQP